MQKYYTNQRSLNIERNNYMKHIVAFVVILLVIITGIVMFKIDFYYGNVTKEKESIYAFFFGIICTLVIIMSMSIIYKRKNGKER
jgi:predicted membrane channel-forming protein YqfA (hemolysin III family)